MNNRELRQFNKELHLFLAFNRKSDSKKKHCVRHVIKSNEKEELDILEAKLKVIGGEWRIHKTVNTRDVEIARKFLLQKLIQHPEKASFVDTEWRTALLQKECKATDYFMLDVDTQDFKKCMTVLLYINEGGGKVLFSVLSPKGFHVITNKFDTREVCKLNYVTLLRDGYYYIKSVGEK